jgi:hypothetical protein
MFSQIPTPAPGTIESWLISAAAIGSIFLIFKKLLARKTPGDTAFVTRTEFHTELTAVRDKIDARHLATIEKIDALGATITPRLTQIETALARVDERTKTL